MKENEDPWWKVQWVSKAGIRTTIYYCPEERFSALDMAARNKGSIQPVSREEAFKAQRSDQKGSDNG